MRSNKRTSELKEGKSTGRQDEELSMVLFPFHANISLADCDNLILSSVAQVSNIFYQTNKKQLSSSFFFFVKIFVWQQILNNICFLVIVPQHMIPFWNPWDIVSTLEGCTQLLVTTRKIRNAKNVQNMGFWRIFAVLMGILLFYPNI